MIAIIVEGLNNGRVHLFEPGLRTLVQAALQSVARPAWLPAGAAWRVQLIASDVDLGGQHSDIRNDQPLDRGKWHFTSRRVHYWRPDGTEALA